MTRGSVVSNSQASPAPAKRGLRRANVNLQPLVTSHSSALKKLRLAASGSKPRGKKSSSNALPLEEKKQRTHTSTPSLKEMQSQERAQPTPLTQSQEKAQPTHEAISQGTQPLRAQQQEVKLSPTKKKETVKLPTPEMLRAQIIREVQLVRPIHQFILDEKNRGIARSDEMIQRMDFDSPSIISNSKEGHYKRIFSHCSGFIVALTENDHVEILKSDMQLYYSLGNANSIAVMPDGLITLYGYSGMGLSEEDKLKVYFLNLSSDGMPVPIANISSAAELETSLLFGNGNFFCLYEEECDLYHSKALLQSALSNRKTSADATIRCKGAEASRVADIANDFMVIHPRSSNFHYILDAENPYWGQYIRRTEGVSFVYSLSNRQAFLVGIRDSGRKIELHVVLKNASIFYPTGIVCNDIYCATELPNGNIYASVQLINGDYVMLDFTLPYLQNFLDQICDELLNIDWTVDAPLVSDFKRTNLSTKAVIKSLSMPDDLICDPNYQESHAKTHVLHEKKNMSGDIVGIIAGYIGLGVFKPKVPASPPLSATPASTIPTIRV
jgi:hypothetical protein